MQLHLSLQLLEDITKMNVLTPRLKTPKLSLSSRCYNDKLGAEQPSSRLREADGSRLRSARPRLSNVEDEEK